jgi:hypothetical protein
MPVEGAAAAGAGPLAAVGENSEPPPDWEPAGAGEAGVRSCERALEAERVELVVEPLGSVGVAVRTGRGSRGVAAAVGVGCSVCRWACFCGW